jgi:hypothetical protein
MEQINIAEQTRRLRQEIRKLNHEHLRNIEKQYYRNNAEKCNNRSLEYFRNHSAEIYDRLKQKVECHNCGALISRRHLAAHFKTKLCKSKKLQNETESTQN